MATEKGSGIDPKRMVVLFYLFAAFVLAVFLQNVLARVFVAAHWADPVVFFDWQLSEILGAVLGVAGVLACWKTPRVQGVSIEIAAELKKVTWPTLRETRAATVAVVIASAIAGLLLFGFDSLWSWLSSKVY